MLLVVGLACQHTVVGDPLLLVAGVGSRSWCKALDCGKEEGVESLAALEERMVVGTHGRDGVEPVDGWCRLLMEKETEGNRSLVLPLLSTWVGGARAGSLLVGELGA